MDDAPQIIDLTPEDNRQKHVSHHPGAPNHLHSGHHVSKSEHNPYSIAIDRQTSWFSPALFAFILVAVAIGVQVFSLMLFKDDNVHIFPALLKTYASHFTQFTYDYGLSRPLGLLYFYAIYTLSLVSMGLAHIVLYAAHAFAAYLLYTIFSKRLSKVESMLIAVLFLAFPFFTEQYGWFAAGNATFALLVLTAQLAIIESDRIDGTMKYALTGALQFVGVLLYETLFFTFVPLILALALREKPVFSKRNGIAAVFLTLPSLLYYILKTFVWPSHYIGFAREAGLNGEIVATVANNVTSFAKAMQYLFLSQGPQVVFWQENFIGGFTVMATHVLIALLMLSFVISAAYSLYRFMLFSHHSDGNESYSSFVMNPLFWLLIGACGLAPAFLLTQPAFPFRVLALPFFSLIVALLLFIRIYSAKAVAILAAILVVVCVPTSLRILDLMRAQSMDDERHFIQVVEAVDSVTPPADSPFANEKVAILIKNMPSSSQTIFAYGEYLSACASADWCLQAAVNRRTGKILQVFVGEAKETTLRIIPFVYDPVSRDMKLDPGTPLPPSTPVILPAEDASPSAGINQDGYQESSAEGSTIEALEKAVN